LAVPRIAALLRRLLPVVCALVLVALTISGSVAVILAGGLALSRVPGRSPAPAT